MLAMKCLAMRIGEGYRDEDDIRYLLRNLGIQSLAEAKQILARYYPIANYPETALPALEEMLTGKHPASSARTQRRKPKR
jgi:hypothetical protein